jgi:uncharacterized RDD family membrane protein YckC
MAMELVNGPSLEDVLKREETLEPEEARRLLIQAARGLRDAQRAGIVHRDVKPSNLLVDSSGETDQLKIADFGVAKSVEIGAPEITRDGCVVGTPLYIAPEQALGHDVDFRADMYSLGCSFFHLLSGRAPFDGSNVIEMMTAHVGAARPRLRSRAPLVPERLADAIDRMMARRAADRFASYDELIDELEACAPIRDEPAGVWPRGAAVVLNLIASIAITIPLGVWGLLVHLAYMTIAHARSGQTLGKYLMRIRVVRTDGRRLGLGLAALRTLLVMWYPILAALILLLGSGPAALASAVTQLHTTELSRIGELAATAAISQAALFCLWAAGFVFAAVHPQKLALHDLLLGTRVVYALPTVRAIRDS